MRAIEDNHNKERDEWKRIILNCEEEKKKLKTNGERKLMIFIISYS
jgi:hypothetical protein